MAQGRPKDKAVDQRPGNSTVLTALPPDLRRPAIPRLFRNPYRFKYDHTKGCSEAAPIPMDVDRRCEYHLSIRTAEMFHDKLNFEETSRYRPDRG